jgi:NAD(P)H-dependent FMN reductase
MPKLGVVIASVREGRVGRPVADWFIERARAHARFDIDVVDLKDVNLPMFAERNHPRLRQYESEHQKAWSARVASLDAFVFVVPEYNYSTAPALLNALDYLLFEWNYKPVAFVSYGGVSGGLRAVQMVKQTVTAMKMVPIPEAVTIPFVAQAIDKETGAFKATAAHDTSAATLLDELGRWTSALAALRA